MGQSRLLSITTCLAVCLFVVALVDKIGRGTADHLRHALLRTNSSPERDSDRQSFEQIARIYGTDKVTSHSYQLMYETHLAPYRDHAVKMLEIGLGCNMDYGPGASYNTWLEFLPYVDLYFIESDARCARKYADKTPKARIFAGDQADADFLRRFVANTTTDGPFDVIVDDGGHTVKQQLTSLQHLWPVIKPGGIYVIEDLQTSFWEDYGGDPTASDETRQTTMKYVVDLLKDMMTERKALPESHDLRSIDCMAEICVFRKKG